MTSLSPRPQDPASISTSTTPILLVRAPTYRGPKGPAQPTTTEPPPRPITPSSASASALREPSPTPSNASRYSVELPTYDDYEHIPLPPRHLELASPSPHHSHARSSSVPYNDGGRLSIDTSSPIPGRGRGQGHQRSRTELLPPFVGQGLLRSLSRSASRTGSLRSELVGSIHTSPSPSQRHTTPRSPSPTKSRPGSSLSTRGGGADDGMGFTGEHRTSPAARRRGEVSVDESRPAATATPGIKGLGSWISGAAAQVSASIAARATPPTPGAVLSPSPGLPELERVKTSSSIGTLQRRDSVMSGRGTPGTPGAVGGAGTPLRPQAVASSSTPTFSGAKATLTSLFGGGAAKAVTAPKTDNPHEDELCTLDLGLSLPFPNEDTTTAEHHKAALALLRRYQAQYKTRVAQVYALKQEAEVRDEELEGETVRARSLKAQLEAISRTLQERDDTLRELREELEEKNKVIDELAGLSVPPTPDDEEVGNGGVDARRSVDGTEDSASLFSGVETQSEWTTANTSSASSIHSISHNNTTPRAPRKSIATSSRHSLLSSADLENQPTLLPSLSPTKPGTVSTSGMGVGVGMGVGRTGVCENCEGKSASQAWIALSRVRSENVGLREKVRGLEEGIEGALEVVGGIGR